jgi:mRNA interferase MazF
MTGYSFGDVLLVPLPFTDLSGSKQRPAVVISSARYTRERPDLILMPITRFGDIPIGDTQAAGLIVTGVIKPIIFTIEAKFVRKQLGALIEDDQRALRHTIAQLIG